MRSLIKCLTFACVVFVFSGQAYAGILTKDAPTKFNANIAIAKLDVTVPKALDQTANKQTRMRKKPGRTFTMEGEREAASSLQLNDDGTFSFWFAAGSLDEIDEGKWRADDDAIYLDSAYLGGTPVIELLEQSKGPSDTVTVVLETSPVSSSLKPLTDVSIYTSSGKIRLEEQDRKIYLLRGAARPIRIEISSISMFNPSPIYTVHVTDPQANKFTVRIDVKKFFSPMFSSLKLTRTGDRLTMKMRDDYEVQYRLVPPNP